MLKRLLASRSDLPAMRRRFLPGTWRGMRRCGAQVGPFATAFMSHEFATSPPVLAALRTLARMDARTLGALFGRMHRLTNRETAQQIGIGKTAHAQLIGMLKGKMGGW